jgi:hypothetical protein
MSDITASFDEACRRADAASGNGHDESEIIQLEVGRLSRLSPIQYARCRKGKAKELRITAAALDAVVKEARSSADEKVLYQHWTVEPWPEVVDTAALLQSIHDRIRRHVIISDSGALAVALWIAMSWVHERSAVHSPLLMITSAERDSGKSTLLGIVGFLARRSLLSVGISAAALYRSIEKWQPAFVIDEADFIFRQNEDLREVVNSGWTRGQGVVRCEPETNEPMFFDILPQGHRPQRQEAAGHYPEPSYRGRA